MSSFPDVSVVIPTLNRPKRLLRAIKSLDDQEYEGNIKCVIIDSSADDSSKHLIDNSEFKSKNLDIKYIKNNQSTRPIDNWILGAGELNSKYSKFLCDDDWLDKDFLKECISILESNEVDCVITDINVVKSSNVTIDNYYKVERGKITKEQVVKSLLGIRNIIPVTPTASLFETEILIESFYESLKHIECTKNLFGFDFFMSYFPVFKSKGTFLINKSLSSSSAGNDSMTLNVKKAKIAYCYFFALINLILSSNYKLSNEEENLVKHKLATFNLKKIFSKDYEELEWVNPYIAKLNFKKLLSSQIKKYYLKIYYFTKK